jgi:hypothetical protein
MSIDARRSVWAHRLLIDACIDRDVPFFWQGPSALLISAEGATDVVRSVLASGEARLLGFEGFELQNFALMPRLDLIFDVERTPSRDPLAALATWDKDVWVDATLARPTAAT